MSGSVPSKAKLADRLVPPSAGPEVMTVSGAATSSASIAHSWTAAVGSTLPAASIARTRKVWSPTARPVYSTGETHGAEAPSSAQLKVESGSLDEKVKVALVSFESAGPESIVVSGGVVSADTTVQLVERRRRVDVARLVDRPHLEACGPSAKPERVCGLEHPAQSSGLAPSRRHS